MGVFLYTMPSILLSGFIFPVYNIPVAVRWIAYINPMSYFLVAVRQIFIKGVGITILWPQLLFLAVAGPILLWLSIKQFHQKLD
jgi:ABC-2 type transport system permease protein